MVAVACNDLASWYEFCRRGKKTRWFERDAVALAAENASGVKAIHDHLVSAWTDVRVAARLN